MAETSPNSDKAERLRALLVADVSQKLLEARSKGERCYHKMMADEMDRLCQTARKLAHVNPMAFADSVISESLDHPDLHPQLVSEMVDRVLIAQRLKARDQANIDYALESIGGGESELKITAELIQRNYPQDPATGHDYARYILAETRRAIEKEHIAGRNHQPQPVMEQSVMNRNQTKSSNRSNGSTQHKRDWAYAARALDRGDDPDKVVNAIAEFRKDLSKPEEYARKTVDKVQAYLDVQRELRTNIPVEELPKEPEDYAALDQELKRVSDLEFARQHFDNGMDAQMVSASLQQDRGHKAEDAAVIAKQAESRFMAERDLNYAIRARGRGETDDKIIPQIAKYREGQMEDPQAYARAILGNADKVRDVERDIPITPVLQQRMDTAQQQYRRDLEYAVHQLGEHSRSEVRQELYERRPEKAYDSPSYRLYSQADHSYTVAVLQQAEKIRDMGKEGKNLGEALDVSDREFRRLLQQTYNDRQRGDRRGEIIERISEKAPSQEFYARALVNEVEGIRHAQRDMSVRPEMARAALEHTMARNALPNRTSAAVER